MTTSYIAHRSSTGDRLRAVLSLSALSSMDAQKAEALERLGIRNVSDLLHYVPVHRARIIAAVARGQVAHDMDLRTLINDSSLPDDAQTLLNASPAIIDGVGDATAELLAAAFNVRSVADLAELPAFLEAESLLRHEEEAFAEPASAPDELIPRAVGAVASAMRLNSFFADRDLALSNVGLQTTTNGALSGIFKWSDKDFTLAGGYIALHQQRWINMGTHLGEVVHSMGLAPGESRNVAVIDWRRAHLFRRTEDTEAREELANVAIHSRALDEVSRGVAQEHQWGRTTAISATAVAGLGAVASGAAFGAAAGGAVGGVSGVGVGAVAGAVIGGVVTSETGGWGAIPGLAAGAVAGGVVGGFVGAGAGAVIGGAAGGFGHIMSESHGDRNVVADDRQNIMDMTSQKASFIRSLRSTIVMDDFQQERARAETFNITNYNHSHALNLTYYEILHRYLVELRTLRVEPFVIVPIKPIEFTKEIVATYWDLLRDFVPDKDLVAEFDKAVGNRGQLALPSDTIADPAQATVTYMEFELRRPWLSQHPAENAQASGYHTTWLENRNANYSGPPMIWHPAGAELDGEAFDKINTGTGFSMRLTDVGRVKVQLPPVTVPRGLEARYSLKLLKAEVQQPGSTTTVTLTDIPLTPTYTDSNVARSFTTDAVDLLFDCKLADGITASNPQGSAVHDAAERVLAYIKRRRYLFTRLLLLRIEAEQVVDLIKGLELTYNGGKIRLSTFVDPVPAAYSSRGVLFRLKPSVDGAPLPLQPLATYRREVEDAFYKSPAGTAVMAREVFLPTSGVFCEAVLGRSNASELIDVTRFWNWQDSPIPNQAPGIREVDTGSRAEPMPNAAPTVPANVINISQPAPLPDPAGVGPMLAALQNGNMFRDMSKAEVLGSVMNNLAGVAERVATSAGSFAGAAAEQALQSAVELGKQVADLAARMAQSMPSTGSSGAGGGAGGPGAPELAEGGEEMTIESAPEMLMDKAETPTERGGAVRLLQEQQRTARPDAKKDLVNFYTSFMLHGLNGEPAGGDFDVELRLPYQTVNMAAAFTPGGWDEVVTLERRPGAKGRVVVRGNPYATETLDRAYFSGAGTFTLPSDGDTVQIDIVMKYAEKTITASSEEEAHKVLEYSLGMEVADDENVAAVTLPTKLPLKILQTLLSFIDVKASASVGGSSGSSTTTGVSQQWVVRVPTGELEVKQVNA